MKPISKILLGLLILLSSSALKAQPAAAPGAAPATGPAAKPAFKPEEIDALAAPIALYPDSLLSQVLMASTYPIEVVQADRWVKTNTSLKGDALAKELEKQTWDPSVKSLVNFPQVLTMMSDKLDWTVKLGDAFIGQQEAVMNGVQALRAKAQATGNLKSNEQQTVGTEAPPAGATTTTQYITIQSANPEVIYVPTYNPTVVYGSWAYPAYPPYYYYPPAYTPRPGLWFGAGVACGMAWGYAWGGCNWHGGDVDIDIDRNVNINNTNIDRNKYQAEFNKRDTNVQGNKSNFQHDPSHRQGVAYRDKASAQKFGGASSAQASQARQEFRGREASGNTFSSAQAQNRAGANTYNRSGASAQNRADANTGAQNRGTPSYNRPSGGSSSYNRPSNTGTRSNAYSGINQGASATRDYSQRGASSRSSAYSGARSGGGSRGGGGRR